MRESPRWFKFMAVVALLWNLLGCMAFGSDMLMTAQDLAQLPEAQQALYKGRPGWAVAATALAVFGGVLGCIGLLLRKRWAWPVFIASLVGVLVQDFSLFVLANGATLAGPGAVALQALVLVAAVGLLLLTHKALVRGWLR